MSSRAVGRFARAGGGRGATATSAGRRATTGTPTATGTPPATGAAAGRPAADRGRAPATRRRRRGAAPPPKKGVSIRGIAQALDDAGVPTAHGGASWHASTVRKELPWQTTA